MQHDVYLALRPVQQLSVNPDMVAVGIGLCAQFAYHLSVDADSACRNELFALAPGGDTRRGYDFL
jgi:hypothetical protein